MASGSVLDVVQDLGGIHAQLFSAAELALWARLQHMPPDAVQEALWERRSLVKTWAMRGTLHLVASVDFPLLVAALRTRQRYLEPAWLTYQGVTRDEIEAITQGVRLALDGQCLTREQLAFEVARQTHAAHLEDKLRSGWGDLLKPAAYQGYLCFGPSQGRNVTFVRPDQWLGTSQEYETEEALRAVIRRYLAAYGPATPEDFARWWGMKPREARILFHQLGDTLTTVDVEGWKAWMLTTVVEQIQTLSFRQSVQLLPGFDPYVVALFHHKTSLLPEMFQGRVYRTAGWVSPVLLVNGRIAGVWHYEKRGQRVMAQMEPFRVLDPGVTQTIQEEVNRLGAFLGAPIEVIYS